MAGTHLAFCSHLYRNLNNKGKKASDEEEEKNNTTNSNNEELKSKWKYKRHDVRQQITLQRWSEAEQISNQPNNL